MPSFSEVPFDLDGIEALAPAGFPPSLAAALRAMFEEVVAAADDIVTTDVAMPAEIDPDTVSEQEIEVCRIGMVAGITALMEALLKHEVIEPTKLVDYLRELLPKDAPQ